MRPMTGRCIRFRTTLQWPAPARGTVQAVLEASALGASCPHLPRDSGYFLRNREKDAGQVPRWKRMYEKLVADRKPLLVKQRPNRQVIDSDELRSHFEVVRDEIVVGAHAAIEKFIAAAPSWGPEGSGACCLRVGGGKHSAAFFRDQAEEASTLPERQSTSSSSIYLGDDLSDADNEYLNRLKTRSLKETRDDDPRLL